MYLELTNDATASFYNNESMNAESKECSFKFNPCRYPNHFIILCFQADITDDLRNFLKQVGVDMDEDVVKLQFYLSQNGKIGSCSYSER